MAVSALVMSYQSDNGQFVVNTHKGIVTLAELLTAVTEARGQWQSLGITKDDRYGVNRLLCVVYVIVPEGTPAEHYFIDCKESKQE